MNTTIEALRAAALKPEPKMIRVLRRLMRGPLHRFEAQNQPIGDSVLNSTISELRKKGFAIQSTLIDLPGHGGEIARVALYELAPESRARASALTGEAP